MAKPKTYEEVKAIIDECDMEWPDLPRRNFTLFRKGDGYLLQISYWEEDVETHTPMLQKSRKWYISTFATETEIVETCFKAARISMEHVLKEHFTYKGCRVYSPHIDINARIELCEDRRFDRREP